MASTTLPPITQNLISEQTQNLEGQAKHGDEKNHHPSVIIMLGPPGVGKGTQAALLAKHYNIPTISTGEALRAFVKNDSPQAAAIKSILNSGKLVNDDTVTAIVQARLRQADCSHGYILDGFPRTIKQAEAFEAMRKELSPNSHFIVLNIQAEVEQLTLRMSSRIVCQDCGQSYNIKEAPPQVAGQCDRCGSHNLVKRNDDSAAIITERMAVYRDKTLPLLKFYQNTGHLHDIDSSGTIEEVHQQAVAATER